MYYYLEHNKILKHMIQLKYTKVDKVRVTLVYFGAEVGKI